MPRLTPTTWQVQARIFEAYGCTFVRQSGSHRVYAHPAAKRPVIIPQYDEVPVTVIRINMKTVGMTREAYFTLLNAR